MLAGFLPRPRAKLRSAEPFSILVAPSDTDRRWLLRISDGPVITTRPEADAGVDGTAEVAADATFTGSAVQVWLGLWNRGDEMVVHGRPDVSGQWRSQVRVSWR